MSSEHKEQAMEKPISEEARGKGLTWWEGTKVGLMLAAPIAVICIILKLIGC